MGQKAERSWGSGDESEPTDLDDEEPSGSRGVVERSGSSKAENGDGKQHC